MKTQTTEDNDTIVIQKAVTQDKFYWISEKLKNQFYDFSTII